ncbi:hypothetical protein [Ruegeria arenilitoris]|uniref:hypothetical protein n=1 Tax=Ruegeria arenilitoris TaxID=1173585 RepID=UPI00147A1A17|nr:hypothetical protein [Ruegeria arenilitoris]
MAIVTPPFFLYISIHYIHTSEEKCDVYIGIILYFNELPEKEGRFLDDAFRVVEGKTKKPGGKSRGKSLYCPHLRPKPSD